MNKCDKSPSNIIISFLTAYLVSYLTTRYGLKIIKNFTGTKDVKLLLEKGAGHRLSETHQLKNITDISG